MKQPIKVFLGALGVFHFQLLVKRKDILISMAPKPPNSTKKAAFVCQNVLTRAQINLICFLLI